MNARRSGARLLAVIWWFAPVQIAAGTAEMEELTRSLEAAELAFAASLSARDLAAFSSHLDEHAVFAAGQVLQGRSAIIEAWSGFFSDTGPSMEWRPDSVVVREGGKLGLSQGPYTLTVRGPDGTEKVRSGRFVSVWERQPDGEWKIIFDSGCPPCPDCPGP